MDNVMYIIISSAMVNNLVFVKFAGSCSVIGLNSKKSSVFVFSLCVGGVMLCTASIFWSLSEALLKPLELEYLSTFAIMLITAIFAQILEWLLKRFAPDLAEDFGGYIPLIAVNGAVLQVASVNREMEYGFGLSMVNALASFAGFLAAMMLMAGVRKKIEGSDIPASFRGMPAALISAAIVSMVFIGFDGILTGIYGM